MSVLSRDALSRRERWSVETCAAILHRLAVKGGYRRANIEIRFKGGERVTFLFAIGDRADDLRRAYDSLTSEPKR